MSPTQGRLEGKVVLITGAAKGQGRSHAVRCAEEGADIIGIDICGSLTHVSHPPGTREDLEQTRELVTMLARRKVIHEADVADRSALRVAVDDGVEQLGRLDVVVANAGNCPMGSLPPDAFTQVVDTNLVGVINTVAVSYPHLDDGASVVAIGSTASFVPGAVDNPRLGPGGLGYSFSKQTLAQYVRQLSLAMAPRMIRVNAVHPTACDTDMLHHPDLYQVFRPDLEHPTLDDVLPALTTSQAMPIPWVEPLDVSNAVLFLASDESRYVTGVQLRVDGACVRSSWHRVRTRVPR